MSTMIPAVKSTGAAGVVSSSVGSAVGSADSGGVSAVGSPAGVDSAGSVGSAVASCVAVADGAWPPVPPRRVIAPQARSGARTTTAITGSSARHTDRGARWTP
ncbi:hypothetical protein [Georgenia yuyongxinii]